MLSEQGGDVESTAQGPDGSLVDLDGQLDDESDSDWTSIAADTKGSSEKHHIFTHSARLHPLHARHAHSFLNGLPVPVGTSVASFTTTAAASVHQHIPGDADDSVCDTAGEIPQSSHDAITGVNTRISIRLQGQLLMLVSEDRQVEVPLPLSELAFAKVTADPASESEVVLAVVVTEHRGQGSWGLVRSHRQPSGEAADSSQGQSTCEVNGLDTTPQEGQPAPNSSRTDSANDSCEEECAIAWLIICRAARHEVILATLGARGCVRTDFQEHYRSPLEPIIAAGTFGIVQRVEMLGKIPHSLAVKHMKPGVLDDIIKQEIRMLAMATGHTNIIDFRGAFKAASGTHKWSLLFEYHPRGDLYDYVIRSEGLLDVEASHIMSDLLMALRHLASLGIFHRDVKPENIMLTGQGRAMLTDFGVAVLIKDLQLCDNRVGSVGYASPEMLTGTAAGCEGDVFASGIVLYFMISMSTPFLAPDPKMMARKTTDCQVNLKYGCFTSASSACRELILSLMSKDVKARPTAAQALRHSFFRIAMHTCGALPDCAVPKTPGSRPRAFDSFSMGTLPLVKRTSSGH